MILNNLSIHGKRGMVNIKIRNGLIGETSSAPFEDASLCLNLDNAIAFPGLINSHDHLDFNLFPQLGDRKYSNYTEWGRHIHKAYKKEIDQVLKIPLALRTQWGIYKNLLNGVTTVINHGEKLGAGDGLISVVENTHCLHSVGFQKNWKIRLNNPFKIKLPVNIHVGEGTDPVAAKEIDALADWNFLHRKLIGVHAVAMNKRQAKKFEAIVWCPGSNYFLLGKTASINLLKNHTHILFGTDSTLTSDWNIWNHLQLARKTGLLSDEELYNSLTINAAKIWQLNSGEIAPGKDADMVIAKNKNTADGFFGVTSTDILLVLHHGQIRLFDQLLMDQLQHMDLQKYSMVHIGDRCKYVYGDLPGLLDQIHAYDPEIKFPVSSETILY